MGTALQKAISLILSSDAELLNILKVTAQMSLKSSLLALLLGVPLGICLGNSKFPGRGLLIILNRTLMGMPPVVCGLLFYILFSGVGPLRHMKLLFTVKIMILAQVALITPIVVGAMETFVAGVTPAIRETARGLGLGRGRTFLLLCNECQYCIISSYLLAFSRSIAEVGAVSMVGGAIAWKTNVMTTAIMQYTNQGNFSLGIALGMILLAVSLLVNVVISLLQRIIPAFSKTYGQKKVLDFPGMELQPGNIYAILGANGSGKSTFSKILADVLPADRKIRLEPSIGYLPQKPYAFRMSVRKNILLGGRDIQKAESLAKALSLTELEHKRADRLSGGETARMAMARLMMGTYDVVILDEPTAAMDMETTAAAETLIQSYVRQTNCILILVTHSLQQARRIADEAMFFQKGEVLEYGPAESLLYSPTRVELKRFLEFYGN